MKNPIKQFEQTLDNKIKLNSNQLAEYINYFEDKGEDIGLFLISYINQKMGDFFGGEIDSITIALDYLEDIYETRDINKDILSRKTKSISQKIDTKQIEEKSKFLNPEETIEALNEVQKEIDDIYYKKDLDPNTFKLLKMIIDRGNVKVLKYVFNNYPSIVNIKDATGKSVYRHVVERIINNIDILNKEMIVYYSNVLDILTGSESFYLSENDRSDILKEICDYLNDVGLEHGRKRKKKVEYIDGLKEKVANREKERLTFETLCDRHFIVPEYNKEIEGFDPIFLPIDDTERKRNDEFIITIDKNISGGALDDALSCTRLPNGNILLRGHIADPLAYYDFHSSIIQEALSREELIFLKRKYNIGNDEYSSIDIFPKSFQELASLKESGDRFTRTYSFEISKDGQEIEYLGMKKTITNVTKNITTVESGKILDNMDCDSDLRETLFNFKDAIYSVNRKNKYVRRTNNRNVRNPNYSSSMIAVFQILINASVANNFWENGYPAAYRVFERDKESDDVIRLLISEIEPTYGSVNNKQIYDSLYTHTYLDTKGIHEDLGGIHYVKATSPLRESEGIMANRCQDLFLYPSKEQERKEYIKELDEYIEMANQKKTNIELFKSDLKKISKRRR